MGEFGIKAAASALKNMVPNAASSGKAKRSANKRSHVQESDSSEYTPEDEEVVGGGTDLDEEPITATFSTSKQPSPERSAELKKLAARKVLATKPKMPPGSRRASERVMASSLSEQPPGVATRSSKRQLLQEPENNCDQTVEADELHPTSPIGEKVAVDQDADVAAPCPFCLMLTNTLNGTFVAAQPAHASRKPRPPTKGVMLERMTRAMGRRLPIIIPEGMKRPEQPVQAAKLASKAGVIVRAEVSILTRWKDYKNDSSHFENFVGKLSAISKKNKQNRARVRHHQATGSRCYISHLYTYREKNKERQVDAVELFKECHNSERKGLSDAAQDAVTSMETMMAEPIADGETPRSSAEVVSKVLSQTSANNTFLKNACLQKSCTKTSTSSEKELWEQLEAEKQGSAVLQELHVLKKKSEEKEEALAKTQEEMAKTQKELQEFKKKQEANDLILQRILALSQVNSTPNPNP
ncbi:hypothetical protein E2562_037664 [Oryza meyeriana var. granulata]|uniref:Uncharacterized protein n=1 Tax=Oryza meyeriana var. granulata TaxID=110450 RepID=A0A6G1EU24_9ORYZ|nr:hypothetical protein E2562_037664 [Oryza meyeriana var. granulata]